ncbi:MAG: alpha/beta fold hydrolase [Clostridiales bacterium]|nr:alpha/beta fold hydrolase [Clostridiales bacterium]
MDRCKTRYPILLVHGVGFRDWKRPLYWGRIPQNLQAQGAALYYGLQDSWATISTNARFLAERIDQVLRETGAEKVNLIGHSKGGLEIRMAASSLGMGDKIASITTIATPHHGSRTIDRLLQAPKSLFHIAAFALNNWTRITGDRNPDFLNVCNEFSTAHMRQFNSDNPDVENVFYQNYACVMNGSLSDINLCIAHFVIRLIEGANDGLVTVDSASWGPRTFVLRGAGRRGISHLDEIDFRRRPLCKKARPGFVSEITDVYVSIAEDLKRRGF